MAEMQEDFFDNTAAYRRLEKEVYVFFLCYGKKLCAVCRNKLLVGGYNAFAYACYY